MISFKHVTFILLSYLCIGCSLTNSEGTNGKVSIRNSHFVDSQQRQIVWNGINLVEKDPGKGYVQKEDEKLFQQFQQWGINCVRYGIHWDGLEPEPGKINEEYLKEIDKRVYWARKNNISLILDMHHDLYGRKFDNGAPLWATLDEGLPHITGSVWSDAYLMSPAVQKSFDNFWLNKPASDGLGIQEHYINLWQNLAKRYSDSISVVGFDIMNEPFMGSRAPIVFQKLMEGFAAHFALKNKINTSEEEIASIWMDEDKRTEALSLLDDKDLFLSILHYAEDEVKMFEENQLSTFYQRTRDAVRATGSKQILFLEHNYFSNLGIKSSFKVPVTEDGTIDSLCAYAPHVYDLVVDTKGASEPGFNRLDVIFDQVSLSAKERNIPMLIGEWGAFYMGSHYKKPAAHHIQWIEKVLAGQTYWSWWPNIETQDYFEIVIKRPYPQYINGELKSYHYDHANKKFTCQWKEDNTSVHTHIFLPKISDLSENDIHITPKSSYRLLRSTDDNTIGYLEVSPTQQERSLEITFR